MQANPAPQQATTTGATYYSARSRCQHSLQGSELRNVVHVNKAIVLRLVGVLDSGLERLVSSRCWLGRWSCFSSWCRSVLGGVHGDRGGLLGCGRLWGFHWSRRCGIEFLGRRLCWYNDELGSFKGVSQLLLTHIPFHCGPRVDVAQVSGYSGSVLDIVQGKVTHLLLHFQQHGERLPNATRGS